MIDLKDFLKLDIRIKRYGIRESLVLIFLRNNKDKAFTYQEIIMGINQLGTDKFTDISGTLSVMAKKGLIEHRSPYWIFKEIDKTAQEIKWTPQTNKPI